MTAKRMNFDLHSNLLNELITAQTGSLDRALLEAVQNSIDAQAKSVRIQLEADRIVVDDDGLGFSSEEEIVGKFGTFGLPHDASEAKVFGTFRMGRGQLMAHGRCLWKSNGFSMQVDHRERPGEYTLDRYEHTVQGCTVFLTPYTPLNQEKLITLRLSLIKSLAWVSVDILLNNQKINRPVNERTWPFRGKWFVGDVAYSGPNGKPLCLYNLGVHVRDFPYERFQLSGDVVSTGPLQLNFARTDVMDICPVGASVQEELRELSRRLVREYYDREAAMGKKDKPARRRRTSVSVPTDYYRLSAGAARARLAQIVTNEKAYGKYDFGQPMLRDEHNKPLSLTSLYRTAAKTKISQLYFIDTAEHDKAALTTAAKLRQYRLAITVRTLDLDGRTDAEALEVIQRVFSTKIKHRLDCLTHDDAVAQVRRYVRRQHIVAGSGLTGVLRRLFQDMLNELCPKRYYQVDLVEMDGAVRIIEEHDGPTLCINHELLTDYAGPSLVGLWPQIVLCLAEHYRSLDYWPEADREEMVRNLVNRTPQTLTKAIQTLLARQEDYLAESQRQHARALDALERYKATGSDLLLWQDKLRQLHNEIGKILSLTQLATTRLAEIETV